jgi:Glycosyltransferase sugar-binding region containing DXD motif
VLSALFQRTRQGDPSGLPQPFGYFDRADHALIADYVADWTAHFPGFRVFGDDDVVPLLQRLVPRHVALYQALQLPAAKSDLARLALLHAHGGLYVDCHCGVGDAGRVRADLADLQRRDLILIERPLPADCDPYQPRLLINGVIFGRKGAPILQDILLQACENLERHVRQVAHAPAGTVVDYDIWTMLGARVLTTMVLEPAAEFLDFRRPLRDGRVRIIPLPDLPIRLSAHRRQYNGVGKVLHWSTRQAEVPLVAADRVPALSAALARSAPEAEV